MSIVTITKDTSKQDQVVNQLVDRLLEDGTNSYPIIDEYVGYYFSRFKWYPRKALLNKIFGKSFVEKYLAIRFQYKQA